MSRFGVTLVVTLIATGCTSSATPNTAPSVSVTTAVTAGSLTTAATTSTSAPVITDPTPTTPVPAATVALTADQVTFASIATIPGALDLAYRTGDDTLYVATRQGQIRAIRAGQLDPAPVLDIGPIIVFGGEQGLLGLAFAPDGKHAYVDYTDPSGNTVIAEFEVGADGVFSAASQRRLLQIKQPFPNHNGGSLRVGPDGYLYIGMGDGGAAGDPDRRALNTGDLLGKILRIDPTPGPNTPYSIPASNPFVGVSGARPEIWSIGLRNPWRFNFDRSTGDLWIADVGQDKWEEIDVAWADEGAGRGANFGWSAFEGNHRFNNDQSPDGVTMPIFEYQHGSAGCSISGGVRYRGSSIPSLAGWYVFGDYCSGQVRALQINDAARPGRIAGDVITLSSTIAGLSSIAQGPDGELYALCVDGGAVYALGPAH
jgi:glucose/arabinose dehydrogenase